MARSYTGIGPDKNNKMDIIVKTIKEKSGLSGQKNYKVVIMAKKPNIELCTVDITETHGNVALYTAYVGDERVLMRIDTECPCKYCRGRKRIRKG
jgi:hypothetical protein